jgi:preprotein translocase subunit SecF
MRPLIVIRRVPKIDFMRWHLLGFLLSGLLSIATVAVFLTAGLNYGIDFTGGTLIEVRVTGGPADLAAMRTKLDALHVGEPSLQGYVDKTTAECASTPPSCVLIRLPEQPGGDAAQQKVVQQVRDALGPGIEYRRTEVVGPASAAS